MITLRSPEDTKGWGLTVIAGVRGFIDSDGAAWVFARDDETAELVITFTRTPGLAPMRLVRADESGTVKRAERKARREQRALRVRGLA